MLIAPPVRYAGPDQPQRVRYVEAFEIMMMMANERDDSDRPTDEPPPHSPKTAASGPRYYRTGFAAPFGVTSLVPFGQWGRVRFRPGCFDAWLRVVAAGLGGIELLADHDRAGGVLATTRTGSLAAWVTPLGLRVGVTTRASSDAVARFPALTALSVEFNIAEGVPGRDERGPLTDCLKAVVGEVSLVRASIFPGTQNAVGQIRQALAAVYVPPCGGRSCPPTPRRSSPRCTPASTRTPSGGVCG